MEISRTIGDRYILSKVDQKMTDPGFLRSQSTGNLHKMLYIVEHCPSQQQLPPSETLVEKGSLVAIGAYSGYEFWIGAKEYTMCRHSDIFFVLSEK